MQQVDITEAQAQITQLLQSALSGEEIIITRDNQPILKLVQFSPTPKRRKRGSAKGQMLSFIIPAFSTCLFSNLIILVSAL